MSSRTLVITNDFPPRIGGIESFAYGLVSRQNEGSVVVLTSSSPGSHKFDSQQDFEIVRHDSSTLLPEAKVRRLAHELIRSYGCDRVLFGAAAPLGLLAKSLSGAGLAQSVAVTHGHEAGWASMPGSRKLLRRIGENTDVISYLGEYTRSKIAPALTPHAAGRMRRLTPGIDTERFHPRNSGAGAQLREELGLGSRPVIVCVSRLLPRKGQDALIQALPMVQQQVSGATLLLVGGGKYRRRLEAMIQAEGLSQDVVLAGEVSDTELPAYFAAGDIFAMPCRTRNYGLDVEGLGIVYLEASATGLPVVAGTSGGAPEAVLAGETGFVIPSNSIYSLVDALVTLLTDRELSLRLGRAGRKWVEESWQWETTIERLELLLAGQDPDLISQQYLV